MESTYKSFVFLSFLIFTVSLGGFLYGYTIGELNFLLVNLRYIYSWNDDQKPLFEGLCNGLFGLGGMLGVVIVLAFLLKKGRRSSLMIADIIGIIGAGICIIYESGGVGIPQFIGRLIGGIAVGINSQIVPIYINEISPIEISGIMGSMFQTMVNLGILISNLTGLTIQDKVDKGKELDYNTDSNWWRFVFLFPVITCLFRFFMLAFVYKFDTPFSLISRNKKILATEAVQMIYKNEYVDDVLNNLESKLASSKDVSYRKLFTFYKKRLILGLLLMITQQFSGINAVVTYSSTLYDKTLNDSTMAKNFTIVNSVILLVAAFISGKISDKFGRRTILMWGNAACTLLLFLMGFLILINDSSPSNALSFTSIAMTFLYLFAFSLSLGPLIWAYQPEILPDKGISLSVICNWFFCTIVIFISPIIIEKAGAYTAYFIFCGFLIFSQLYMIKMLKETKGKNFREVEQIFGENAIEKLIDGESERTD